MEAAVATSRPRSVARWTILGGLLYVIFFVVGTIMLFSGAPERGRHSGKGHPVVFRQRPP